MHCFTDDSSISEYTYMNLTLGLRFTAISIRRVLSFNLYNGSAFLHSDVTSMLPIASGWFLHTINIISEH